MPPARRSPQGGLAVRPTYRRTAEPPRRGRRPMLSLEAVVAGAIELLDEAGEDALTFRALAGRLGTGVGSLYHYVSGKDELLDRATDELLGEVLDELDLPSDPYEALRVLSIDLYSAMQAHHWMAAYLMRDTGMQPNSMRLFDLFGRQVMSLDLTSRQQFVAVSSLVSFVVGSGAELREPPAEMIEANMSQEEALREYADAWRALDEQEFPFVRSIADEFENHEDDEQFREGVDLFLDGIRAQAKG